MIAVNGKKQCGRCKVTLLPADFNRNRAAVDGLDNNCKKCRKERQAEYSSRPEIKEHFAAYHRQYYLSHKDGGRKSRLKNYGLEPQDWDAFLEKAGHCCQICRSDKDLCVDHDHKSSKVRGVLCNRCNLGIGILRDSRELLEATINYLKEEEDPT